MQIDVYHMPTSFARPSSLISGVRIISLFLLASTGLFFFAVSVPPKISQKKLPSKARPSKSSVRADCRSQTMGLMAARFQAFNGGGSGISLPWVLIQCCYCWDLDLLRDAFFLAKWSFFRFRAPLQSLGLCGLDFLTLTLITSFHLPPLCARYLGYWCCKICLIQLMPTLAMLLDLSNLLLAYLAIGLLTVVHNIENKISYDSYLLLIYVKAHAHHEPSITKPLYVHAYANSGVELKIAIK